MSTKEKFRIVNFRSLLILTVALVAAIFLCLIAVNQPALGFSLLGCFFLGLLAAGILTRNKKWIVPATLLLSAVLSAVVFTVFYITATKRIPLDYSVEHTVEAKVQSAAIRDGEGVVLLKSVKVDGAKVAGRLQLRIEGVEGTALSFAKPGDLFTLHAKLYEVRLVDGWNVDAAAFRNGIRMRAYPKVENCSMRFGTMNGLEKMRVRLRGALEENLGKHYADLAYGMLTGDKVGLSADVRDYFSISGLGHILAVSGLHIGFLSALMLFLLKRTPRWLRVSVTSAVLALYTIFAGFTPSVVRAVVMCEVGMLTLLNGQRRDPLSSLSIAMFVILLPFPYSLFDIGFIMSCSAVFGIICFSKNFTRGMRKIRMPQRIASAVSVSASAQLGLLPATIYYFNSVQVYSIIANVLLMPLITVTFVLLLLCSVVTLILPMAGVILKGPGLCLAILDMFAYGISTLPFASILVYGSALVFVSYLLYFFISPFVMLPKGKRWVNLGAAILAAACLFVPVHYFKDDNAVIPIQAFQDVTSIVSIGRDVYLIGDCNDAQAISRMMKAAYVRKVKGVYVTGLTERNAQALADLNRSTALGPVYFPAQKEMEGIQTLAKEGMDIHMFEEGDDLEFATIYSEERFLGYSLREKEKDIAFLGYKTRYTALPESTLRRMGVIRCYLYLNERPEHIYITNLPAGYLGHSPSVQISVGDEPGVVFDYRNGEVYRRR